MRVMILVKGTAASEAATFSPEFLAEMMAAMGRFNDELESAGLLVLAAGLTPSGSGKRVGFDGASRSVSDGPFEPAEQLVSGFWIWEVRDLDEAVAWVKRCPNPMPVPSVIEIRPFHD